MGSKRNSAGLTPAQIKKLTSGIEMNQKPVKSLIKAKSGKPAKAIRKTQAGDSRCLLAMPFSTTDTAFEYRVATSIIKADISVIVPLYKSSAANLIDSWSAQNGYSIEVIFVDDNCPLNSKDAVLSRLASSDLHWRIYASAVTQGWEACCNIGAAKASGDILFFMHPDIILPEDWLGLVQQINNAGAVGPLNLHLDARTVINAGLAWSWAEHQFKPIGNEVFDDVLLRKPLQTSNCPAKLFSTQEHDTIDPFCLGTSRRLFNAVGGFCCRISSPLWSAADYCMTLKERGLPAIVCGEMQIFRPDSLVFPQPDHGKMYFHNKWVASNRLDGLVEQKMPAKKEVNSIVVRRRSAHGDVLMAAAVLPALKQKYPKAKVFFDTDCPEILHRNPWVEKVVGNYSERWFDLYIDLDLAYEYRPHENVLAAFAEACGVPREACCPFLHREPVAGLPDAYMAIHAGKTTWAGRDWSAAKFDIIARRLMTAGIKVICVGTETDHGIPCDLDLRGQTSVHQLGSVIASARLFIGIDSFPMHVAQCFHTRGVCFFGSVLPATRLISDKITPVTAKGLTCLGCHHRNPVPCTVTASCEIGIQDCINNVSVEQVWRAINNLA